MKPEKEHWDIVIEPHSKKFSLNLSEVWKYKDLITLYVKRDIITVYKQTILGPLWYIIQPIFTAFMYTMVFGNIANIPTDGIPHMVFYMSAQLCWNYFSDCLGGASGTFAGNAAVFSKVYFPRLVVPISNICSNLFRLCIQILLFIGFYMYFYLTGYDIQPNLYLLFVPFFILMLALFGFGVGIIISSFTTKYRDLGILFGFLTQLWMYATPVIYPLSAVPDKIKGLKWIIELNPLTPIVEAVRYGCFGVGTFSLEGIIYSFCVITAVLLIGIVLFNKVERKFIDTI